MVQAFAELLELEQFERAQPSGRRRLKYQCHLAGDLGRGAGSGPAQGFAHVFDEGRHRVATQQLAGGRRERWQATATSPGEERCLDQVWPRRYILAVKLPGQ
jgi:hypothetical protein